MNLQLINRIIKTSIIFAFIAFPFLGVYISIPFAIAWLLGCFWGCLNLAAIKYLVVQVITPNPKSKLLIFLFIFVKFPVIYLLGYLLVIWSYPPLYGLAAGFSSILLVTLLKAVSRAILQSKNMQVNES